MNRSRTVKLRIGLGLALLGITLLIGGIVEGHAVLKESHPVAGSTVKGPEIPIMLKYNVRIDAKLSKLQLLHPDNSTSDLTIDPQQTSPDTLNSKATGLQPGAYRIRWQVLAPDGHITRGEIPFTVAGS